MSLKDKLNKRAASLKKSNLNSSHKNLPDVYRHRLQESSQQKRLSILFSGWLQEQFVQIELDPGHHRALVSVYLPKGSTLDRHQLEALIGQAGVVHGIDLGGVMSPSFEQLDQSVLHIVFAQATQAYPGSAGRVELLKRPYNSSSHPDLENFDPIEPEEEIALIIPPVKGVPGMSVLGQEIPTPSHLAAEYKTNTNIRTVNDGERTVLVSSIKGVLSCYNHEIAINPELTIHNDITVHRGHLYSNINTVIKDNVLDNVSLTVTGSLRINGLVRQAHLEVSDHLYINKGIFGKSESHVSVGANFKALYLNEVDIDCEGDIVITKEILNSHVWTRSSIDSPLATIVGGTTFSQNDIRINTIGSELGLKTLIVAGLDKREYRIKNDLLPKLEEKKMMISKAEEILKGASNDNKELIRKNIEDLKREVLSREMDIEQSRQKSCPQNLNIKIYIRQTLFPGVTILMGDQEYTVMEKITGPLSVQLEKNSIHLRRTQ